VRAATIGGEAVTDDPAARSVQACPICGAHRLALIEPSLRPDYPYMPLNEAWSMPPGVTDPEPPAIECLECGSQWPDLAAFRAGAAGIERDVG
jgi:hypothetical protein